MSHRILVVDDDPHIRDVICFALEKAGMKVAAAQDGADAMAQFERTPADLIVLDIGMPEMDGLEVCRQLRRKSEVPILFLSARSDEIDRVLGLELGGDDYVTKPFSLEELVARVRAVLRRTGFDERTSARLVFADLELDDDTHEVWRGRTRIDLTPTEYKLLRYLMLNARRALSKSQILDHVWEYDFDGDANVVETYISYLRKKIDKVGPPLIHTIRGVGYTLRTPPEE
jgi:two-component system OmpR family response regulator